MAETPDRSRSALRYSRICKSLVGPALLGGGGHENAVGRGLFFISPKTLLVDDVFGFGSLSAPMDFPIEPRPVGHWQKILHDQQHPHGSLYVKVVVLM